MDESKIYSVWQPVGYSTHEIARKISLLKNVKTSHTGTLDPMAEGVVIILLADERLKKYEYAKWEKEYVFDLVLGISTDTQDGMGIILKISDQITYDEDKFISVINSFKGDYEQKVPLYSAIKIKGKPLHFWARKEALDKIEIPKRKGVIKEICLVEKRKLSTKLLSAENISRIQKIKGDFRQTKIISQWNDYAVCDSEFYVLTIRALLSKGLYVRSLGSDIAKKLDIPAYVHKIVRTRNGNYTKENSKKIKDMW